MECHPDAARQAAFKTVTTKRILLSIIELGGYPDFKPLYRRAGFEVETVSSVRKALGLMKKLSPDVIVAEFNFQSDFRDRSSSRGAAASARCWPWCSACLKPK